MWLQPHPNKLYTSLPLLKFEVSPPNTAENLTPQNFELVTHNVVSRLQLQGLPTYPAKLI